MMVERRKRGRPASTPDNLRSVRLPGVRVTPEEADLFYSLARKQRTSLAALTRRLLRARAKSDASV